MKKLISIFLVLTVLQSCKSGESKTASPAQLQGTWELSTIEDGSFESLFSRSVPTIQFDTAASTVMGRNSCNQYSGSYTADHSTISFDGQRMISTKMACEGGGEKVFMESLTTADEYRISEEGTTLTLLKAGKVSLTFKRT